MDADLIGIIIQGGAVGLCAAVIIIGHRKDTMVNTTLNNHLHHTYLAQQEDTKARIVLAESITKLADKIDSCPLKK